MMSGAGGPRVPSLQTSPTNNTSKINNQKSKILEENIEGSITPIIRKPLHDISEEYKAQ